MVSQGRFSTGAQNVDRNQLFQTNWSEGTDVVLNCLVERLSPQGCLTMIMYAAEASAEGHMWKFKVGPCTGGLKKKTLARF